jgi:hypothetical protein
MRYLNILVMMAHIGYSLCHDIAVWRQFAMRGVGDAARDVEDAVPYEGVRGFDISQQFRAVFYA